jgi:hypothetical protein
VISDGARLRQVLGAPELAWLVQRARRRLSQGLAGGSVTLPQASPAQRDAVERLLGRRAARGGSVSVRLEDLEALLRDAGICDSLAEAGAAARDGRGVGGGLRRRGSRPIAALARGSARDRGVAAARA